MIGKLNQMTSLQMNRYVPGRLRSFASKAYQLWRRWVDPVCPIQKTVFSFGLYAQYWVSWIRYTRMPAAEKLRLVDGYPRLDDRTTKTPFDPHYLYQAVWAMERIAQSRAQYHIDIGSDVRFVGMLTTHLPVIFVDIRPLRAEGIKHLISVAGNLLELPIADASIKSLSCLHIAEHVGLGRYGGPLDPSGTRRACAELARVLAPDGNLFFSLPVGRSRVCFNAHRIHSPAQILDYFQDLTLVEFAAVDDLGNLLNNVRPNRMTIAEYGCGLFWFQRRSG